MGLAAGPPTGSSAARAQAVRRASTRVVGARAPRTRHAPHAQTRTARAESTAVGLAAGPPTGSSATRAIESIVHRGYTALARAAAPPTASGATDAITPSVHPTSIEQVLAVAAQMAGSALHNQRASLAHF